MVEIIVVIENNAGNIDMDEIPNRNSGIQVHVLVQMVVVGSTDHIVVVAASDW